MSKEFPKGIARTCRYCGKWSWVSRKTTKTCPKCGKKGLAGK